MKKMAAAAVTLAALAMMLRTQITRPQPAPAADELQAVTLVFGSKDQEPSKWDGSASISQGKIERVIGYHFTESCKVDGTSWTCSTHPWAPFAGGMHPNEKPQPRPTPVEAVGVTIEFRAPASAELRIQVPKGEFSFRPMDVPPVGGIYPLQASVEVYRTPVVETLTDAVYEDDYPAVAVVGEEVVVAWQGYRDGGEHVFTRSYRDGRWGERRQWTRQAADIFQPRVLGSGEPVWSERQGEAWLLKAGEGKVLVGGEGSNLFLRAAGTHLAYQRWRKGRSEIYYKDLSGSEVLLSDPKRHARANDWNPALAVDRYGTVWVAWDGYADGNYNIYLRPVRKGKPGELVQVTKSSRFHAHPSVAVDAQNRVWIAWDEAPENWGKDVGFFLSYGTGLYESREVRVAVYAGGKWLTPLRQPAEVVPYGFKRYFQTPRLVADSLGNLWLLARPRTSSRLPTSLWAAGGKWEVLATYYSGDRWSELILIPGTVGRNEGGVEAAADAKGNVWVAAVTDHRLWGGPNFGHPPQNNDIVVAKLRAGAGTTPALAPLPPEPPGGLSGEPREREQIAALRAYTIQAGGKSYHIYRGDMHRHTDISLDGAGDGSLWDAYRYAMDAAGHDYFMVTDHQSGTQEYTWWRIEKSSDMFHVPGFFTTLYGTERSLGYPNGHRNLIFGKRGIRILPIQPTEQKAVTNTGSVLYPYLRRNQGLATSHTSHTNMGTDWRDNDPDLEPIVEIYQGARTSAEHEGAPLSPTGTRTELWAGGYRPLGFVWNAWAKGYKLGVQASSDHVSTHTSYACVIAENSSREALMDAMRKRHTYAATSNILLDYRVNIGGASYLQGDAVEASGAPEIWAKVVGTGPLRKVDVIRDNQYVYSQQSQGESFELRWRDNDAPATGEHYYYVRVEQQNGHVAWSSPVWIQR
jgi:hypothetical protein